LRWTKRQKRPREAQYELDFGHRCVSASEGPTHWRKVLTLAGLFRPRAGSRSAPIGTPRRWSSPSNHTR